MNKFIIINADDLGYNNTINERIFSYMGEGKVTSASIIPNGPSLDEVFQNINKYNICSFGVHLNITEFSPLTACTSLNKILDCNGNFSGLETIKNAVIDRDLKNGIFKEFSLQIEKIKNKYGDVSHIDSHQHIHTQPKLFFIIKDIQKKYNIKNVRISRNIYPLDYKVSKILMCKKLIYNFMLRHYDSSNTVDGFCSFIDYYSNYVNGIDIRQKTIEIMIHPGSINYKSEDDLFYSEWDLLFGSKVKLINYNQI